MNSALRVAYASTAYGVQGATVPASHAVLSDALDASGVYVGMTRGRLSNTAHLVAADVARAHGGQLRLVDAVRSTGLRAEIVIPR